MTDIKERLPIQFHQNKELIQWLEILPTVCETELEGVYRRLTYCVDEARGYQLDMVGKLIGLRRVLLMDNGDFFGYQGTPNADGYGVSPYYDREAAYLTPVPDWLFRVAIKAKLLRNRALCTVDEVILASEFILGEECTFEEGVKTFRILPSSGTVSMEVRTILAYYDLEIKPLGVKFLGYGDYTGTCLLYTSPSPRDRTRSRMPSSA